MLGPYSKTVPPCLTWSHMHSLPSREASPWLRVRLPGKKDLHLGSLEEESAGDFLVTSSPLGIYNPISNNRGPRALGERPAHHSMSTWSDGSFYVST